MDLDTFEIVGHVVAVPSRTPDSDQQHCETNQDQVSDPVPAMVARPSSPPRSSASRAVHLFSEGGQPRLVRHSMRWTALLA